MSNDKPDYYAMAEGISKTIGKVTKPLTDAQFIALAGAVAVYVEKALTHAAEKQAGPVAVVNDDDPHAILRVALRVMPNTSTLKSEEQAEDIVAVWRAAVASIQCTAVTAPPSPLTEQDKEDAELLRTAAQALACMRGLQQHLGYDVCSVEADSLDRAIRAARAKKEQP